MSASGPRVFNSLTAEQIKEKQAAERKKREELALQRAKRIVEKEYRLDRQVFEPLRSYQSHQQNVASSALPGKAPTPESNFRSTDDNKPKCK